MRVWWVVCSWLPGHPWWVVGLCTARHGAWKPLTSPSVPTLSAPAAYWGKAVESLFIGACLAQLASLVLQEGKRGCVPGTAGIVGLGVMGCLLWGLINPFLGTLSLSCWHSDFAVSSLAQPEQCLEIAPLSPPELYWGASGAYIRNWMRERPEHLPHFGASACTAGHQLKSTLAGSQEDVLGSVSSLATWCFIFVG